jgi:hypothetical protein
MDFGGLVEGGLGLACDGACAIGTREHIVLGLDRYFP